MNLAEATEWLNKMKGTNDGLADLFSTVLPDDVMVVNNMLDGAGRFAQDSTSLYEWTNRISKLFSDVQTEQEENK